MGTLFTDEVMNAFCIVAEPNDVAHQIKTRFGDIVDRTSAAYGNLSGEDRQRIVQELTQ